MEGVKIAQNFYLWIKVNISNNFSLKRHMVAIHEDSQDFRCKKCGKSFAEKGGLQYHMRYVHENIKDYQCDHCGLALTSKQGKAI